MNKRVILAGIVLLFTATGLFATTVLDNFDFGEDSLNELKTYERDRGVFDNDAKANAYKKEIVVPATVTRYKHVQKTVTRITYIDCAPPPPPAGAGGDGVGEVDAPKIPAWNYTYRTKTAGSNRWGTLYGFMMHFTEDGGSLGGGGDVYIYLASCPLGDQGIFLHQNSPTKACGGTMTYSSVWKGGFRSYRKFWISYVPDP